MASRPSFRPNLFSWLGFFASILLVFSSFSFAWSVERTPVGTVIEAEIGDLRPMQLSIGKGQVRLIQRKIEKARAVDHEKRQKEKATAKETILTADTQAEKIGMEALKLENKGLIVIGPGGEYYLVDKHHFTRALHDSGETKMYVEVVDDLSHLSQKEFWQAVRHPKDPTKQWVYLIDHKGKLRSHKRLPNHVGKLKNNRYRFLAWLVKKADAFEDVVMPPFQEFRWAEFFRERFQLKKGDKSLRKIFPKAVQVAGSEKASHLPGWKLRTEKISKKSCLKILKDIVKD